MARTKLYRTFNMTGRMEPSAAGTPSHKRLHIGHLKTDRIYSIVEFRVYPSSTNANCQLSGTLTHKRNDSLEPKNPDFRDTSQIAWCSYNICDGNTIPSPGITNCAVISESSIKDEERYFKQDVHLHVVDEVTSGDINYYVRIAEMSAPADVSAIVALQQFGELVGQN